MCFKAPLPSMVFQWFYHPWTITIECLQINHWNQWFFNGFPNSGVMVSDGFDLEKTKTAHNHNGSYFASIVFII